MPEQWERERLSPARVIFEEVTSALAPDVIQRAPTAAASPGSPSRGLRVKNKREGRKGKERKTSR